MSGVLKVSFLKIMNLCQVLVHVWTARTVADVFRLKNLRRDDLQSVKKGLLSVNALSDQWTR